MLKIIFIILLIVLTISSAMAFPFDGFNPTPEPTKEQPITWTPVDKIWIYNPESYNCYGDCVGIRFFVTYKSSDGRYEVRKVDATTWYNTPPRNGASAMYEPMYFQGALS